VPLSVSKTWECSSKGWVFWDSRLRERTIPDGVACLWSTIPLGEATISGRWGLWFVVAICMAGPVTFG
jgi:hypothetical protein